MWEKYANEIGKQDGPLMHVDENSQYEHLKGFVAFDMEQWWAERSISCMINDSKKDEPKVQTSLSASNSTSEKYATNKNTDLNNNSYSNNELYFSSDNKNLSNGQYTTLATRIITSTAKSKHHNTFLNQDTFLEMSKKYNNNSKYSFNLTVSRNLQNNLQMCFS